MSRVVEEELQRLSEGRHFGAKVGTDAAGRPAKSMLLAVSLLMNALAPPFSTPASADPSIYAHVTHCGSNARCPVADSRLCWSVAIG